MEQIEYTRTVVPSSMRSPYWKYFGFPSDNGNNILTRQKIVCTICNTAIAYNKNTSNLRTHLMSKHVEIFQKIITPTTGDDVVLCSDDLNNFIEQETGINVANATNNVVTITTTTSLKRRRSELPVEVSTTEDIQTKNVCGLNQQQQQQLPQSYLAVTELKSNLAAPPNLISEEISNSHDELSVHCQQLEIHHSGYTGFDIVDVSESNEEDELPDTLQQTEDDQQHTNNQQPFTYIDVMQPIEIQPKQQNSLENMLADMIQTDLLTLDILKSDGFCKYNQQLSGLTLDGQTLKRVVDILRQRFINSQQLINNNLRHLSHNLLYSLSTEHYRDNDQQDILNIYFHYLNDGQTDLKSILCYSGSNRDFSTDLLEDLLKDINLKNCCGIVVPAVNNAKHVIKQFAEYHDIDVIECLESMLSRCLYKIFDMEEFCTGFENLCDLMEKKSWLHKPTFKPRCCWSKFNYLEYIFDNLEPDEAEIFIDIKQIIDYIKPLKMALDIVTDEQLPLCTLTRPLVLKLFEEHFSFLKTTETFLLTKVQKILEQELKESVITSSFLNQATYFDARFHRDFALQDSVFDLNHLKVKVCTRFKDVLDLSYITKPMNIKTEDKTALLLMNSKKSSLKTFFKRDAIPNDCAIANDLKTNLDIEFEDYQNESCLDLDQNPILWWQQQSINYKQLHEIAKHYLTIPCCSVPRLNHLDLEQKCIKLERRRQLSQYCYIERNLWYLYYNDWSKTDV